MSNDTPNPLQGYTLEKFKKGWAVRNRNGEFLGWGDEEGEQDNYHWTYQRSEVDIKTLYRDSEKDTKAILLDALNSWDAEQKEFTEKPSQIIKLLVSGVLVV